MAEVKITTEYITLQQLLKEVDVLSTGGMVKWYLREHDVYVNGEREERRGRKLYDGDVIAIPGAGKFTVTR
ncbi:S4 domain-containing protein YaaA [Fictibacillus sp. Mic-4]|uniref:S4 domain-containing protein YaaA n=1 Tax=Fictibacillus TaxID=1329200 RepID=UPI00040871BD|nr:S4 domain-containing protein YaaA [Fictibacillus gelatini]